LYISAGNIASACGFKASTTLTFLTKEIGNIEEIMNDANKIILLVKPFAGIFLFVMENFSFSVVVVFGTFVG